MKPASRLFYLSLFALWSPEAQCKSDESCAISPKAIVSDACASYSTLEQLNRDIKPALEDLTRTTDFFSHYRLNLFNKECPFWNDENGMCGNIACAVETLDNEEDIPEVWRAKELGKLEGPRAKHPGKSVQKEEPKRPLQGKLGEDVGESCVVEYDDECDDRDYCVPDDEGASSKGDYVSLLRNPERFTGYAGDGAKQVWDAIYRENCFQKSSFPKSASLGDTYSVPKNPAAQDFRAVMQAAGRQHMLEQQREQNPLVPFVTKTGLESEDECLEKRVFYKIVSGMHASISTHLCWDFLNQTTGQWQPNLSCYINRLHKFPERISNLYFNYALLTRAVAKLGPYLSSHEEYTFCTGDPAQDADTRAKVLAVTSKAANTVPGPVFDESIMFKNGEGPSLKEDFRNRFRNISRLMDCVGCDKCRLWGKLQTAGYGTALKVLFEFANNDTSATTSKTDEIPFKLKRTELVALFNTYARLSSSLDAIQKFRAMVEESEEGQQSQSHEQIEGSENSGAHHIPDRAKKPRHVIVSTPVAADDAEASVTNTATTAVDEAKAAGVTPAPMVEHQQQVDNNNNDDDDDDDEFHEFQRQPQQPDTDPNFVYKKRTLKDDFENEFRAVLAAFKLVIKSYFNLPALIYEITITELKRFWQFYVGLPVMPRTWEFRRPSLDEL
ncbi:endoplasmic reticulum Oxidoreductin 1-domain-containing protein [Neurospora hispaniola]|uniref:Endoplasmic reticulum Oxidoreductin 1-domain-containing protein n=1 Tax=Neurospora hispaniola TaxID=588809 RepID=A0AAJ0I3X0_9PEZI|nr:endoplasmic reticulum Oxidoreductin 1-domain-containing protein [Neurospora hispaniola]